MSPGTPSKLKLIYLDSSDFSELSSDDQQLKESDRAVLTALRNAVSKGSARVLLSPIIISENVHQTRSSKYDAIRRASLMRELCGNTTLKLPTDICRLEVERATLESQFTPVAIEDVLSRSGEWFGLKNEPDNFVEDSRRNVQREIDNYLAKLPRSQRRKLKSQLDPSKERSKSFLKEILREGRRGATIEFPFNLIDPDHFTDLLFFEKDTEKLQLYLRDLMADPYFLFSAIDATNQRETLYTLARSRGQQLSAGLYQIGFQLFQIFESTVEQGRKLSARDISDRLIDLSALRRSALDVADLSLEHLSDVEIATIVEKCPSIKTIVHVISEYGRDFIQSNIDKFRQNCEQPKELEPNDFSDILHIYYAPYVDIFRCDSRFARRLKLSDIAPKIAATRSDILTML